MYEVKKTRKIKKITLNKNENFLQGEIGLNSNNKLNKSEIEHWHMFWYLSELEQIISLLKTQVCKKCLKNKCLYRTT